MTINASACPLCGQSNRCAMEIEKIEGQKQAACWCTGASFSAELLAQVPPNSQNKACICADCAIASRLDTNRSQ